jgi:hypothetical protein
MMTLDRKYRDELILALRLRDISGERVGDVIAEVEAHVAETGEDPRVAFGPPKEYAAKVAEQLDTRTGKPSKLRTVVGTITVGVLSFVGASMLLSALQADGALVPVTPADLVAAVLCVCLLLPATMLTFRAATAVTGGRKYGVPAAIAYIAGVGGMPLSKLLLDDETAIFEITSSMALAVGLVALLGAILMLWQAIRYGRIVDPRSARTR